MKTKQGSLRRSGRRVASIYKKGDYIEFNLNGGVVTGRLLEKSLRTSNDHPIWIVAPSDRRRKNEEVSEEHMGRIIDVDEAMNNKSLAKASRNSRIREEKQLQNNGSSDGSKDEEDSGGGDEEISKLSKKRRKSDADDSNYDYGRKQRKTVTFRKESNSKSTSAGTSSSKKKGKSASTRIGTRSSSKSSNNASDGDLDLLPSLPLKKNKTKKQKRGAHLKKSKKDENVVVVKMLTGTLYLYRGDRPRAEFVRSK